jgi:inner membrane protein
MASVISHAVVALAMGRAVEHPLIDRRVLALGVLSAVIPDLDVLGMYWGIEYGALWGHRGLTHSLAFAAIWGVLLAALWCREQPARTMAVIGLYLFLCTASHGLLDAMTDGGLGVAFLSPFDRSRYFFPMRPVAVSPIGVREFFNPYGLQVLLSEVRWIWLPTLLMWAGCRVLARRWPRRTL